VDLENDASFLHSARNTYMLPVIAGAPAAVIEDRLVSWYIYCRMKTLNAG
jgi:hypothetical protein